MPWRACDATHSVASQKTTTSGRLLPPFTLLLTAAGLGQRPMVIYGKAESLDCLSPPFSCILGSKIWKVSELGKNSEVLSSHERLKEEGNEH